MKTLKTQKSLVLWNKVSHCVESDYESITTRLAQHIQCSDRIVLEGPLGVGKTTFTQSLLTALKIQEPHEGSPSFSIAHEYTCPKGNVIHLDFYRIQSPLEIEQSGLLSYYWEREAIIISEWLSSWPDLEHSVMQSNRVWKIIFQFSQEVPELQRHLEIFVTSNP